MQGETLYNLAERPAWQLLPVERFPFFHVARRTMHWDSDHDGEGAYCSVPPESETRRQGAPHTPTDRKS